MLLECTSRLDECQKRNVRSDNSRCSAKVLVAQRPLLAFRQQAGVSSGRRGVHRDDLLSGETSQVVRAGAGETRASERLRANHRAGRLRTRASL